VVATAALLTIAFAAGLALTWLVLRAGHDRFTVVPNARSSHSAPTPTLGGVGIVLPTLVAAAILGGPLGTVVLAGGGALALVGAIDDVRDLPASWRWPVHVLAVLLALALAPVPALVFPPLAIGNAWIVLLVTGVLLVWLVNLYNFMDGIDGLAGVQCVTFCGGVLTLGASGPAATLALVLAGASTGFLAFNRPPARIFMGDVGSGFLGFVIGVLALALAADAAVPFVASMILVTGFWFDATWTVCARMLAGRRFTAPHRDHLYQKLARRYGHARTTAGYLGVTALWLWPLAWWADAAPAWSMAAVALAVLPFFAGCLALGAGTPEPAAPDVRA
jgi:Fuc2NAc and GlcNAc transferase